MNAAEEMLKTLTSTAPDAPTRCEGWTAHELVAHMAAGAREMAELIEDRLAGRETRATRGFEDREGHYRDMADEKLREELFSEALRLGAAVATLGESGTGSVAFSGRSMTSTELDLHGQSEAALHRWDLVGSDEVSRRLLSAPELTTHAMKVMNTMLSAGENPSARAARAGVTNLCVAIHTAGQPDVCVVIEEGQGRLEVTDEHDYPVVLRTDADSRLLLLWGRRPLPGTFVWQGEETAGQALEAFLFS